MKIPKSFECVDEYLGSFIYPLLEETRAELASAMETVYEAPFAEVTYFEEGNDFFLYDVKVEHGRNGVSNHGREPYRALPGDIVLISDLKPEKENVFGPPRAGCTFILGSVRDMKGDESDDDFTSSSFKLKTGEHVMFIK